MIFDGVCSSKFYHFSNIVFLVSKDCLCFMMFYVCQISTSTAIVDDAICWAESSPAWSYESYVHDVYNYHIIMIFFCITNLYIVDISWFFMRHFKHPNSVNGIMFFIKSRCRDGCTTYMSAGAKLIAHIRYIPYHHVISALPVSFNFTSCGHEKDHLVWFRTP